MNMTKLSLLAPVFALAVAFAQGPPTPGGFAPPVTELKTYMNLTDTQITSITNSNQALMTASRTVMEQIRTKRTALQALLTAGSTDAAALGKLLLEIQALEKQITDNHTKAQTAAVSFLSADQKTKLKALEDSSKLREEIGEAARLNLLAAPAGGASAVRQGPPNGFRGPR